MNRNRSQEKSFNRTLGKDAIEFLMRNGYFVEVKNSNRNGDPIQFRVNDTIDIYPVNKKFCVLPGTWGKFSTSPSDFVIGYFINKT